MFDDERNGDDGELGLIHVGTGGVDDACVIAHVGTGGVEGARVIAHVGTGGAERRGGGDDNDADRGQGWRAIDRELRRVARARGGLDADELLWLARAERAEIHKEFAYATILEYVERVLGYGPRVARDRLRVARALETLPRMREELQSARLSYSAVREVSRVAKPWNEERWIERIAGKSLREIEEELAGRQPGDDPEDEPKPELALRPITFDLTSRTLALFRDACRLIEEEVGHHMTEDEIIAVLCASALRDGPMSIDEHEDHESCLAGDDCSEYNEIEDGVNGTAPSGGDEQCARVSTDDASVPRGDGASAGEDQRAHVGTDAPFDDSAAPPEAAPREKRRQSTPAPYQVALTICAHCRRATHDAAGRSFDVSESVVEQAMCHAQFLGRVDVGEPARMTRNIPAATVRAVWRRDCGRCVVPGCRSTRHIEVHHIRFRSDRGDNSMGNLACLCWAHHAALHDGKLTIAGRAPDALVFERIDPLQAPQRPHRGPRTLAASDSCAR